MKVLNSLLPIAALVLGSASVSAFVPSVSKSGVRPSLTSSSSSSLFRPLANSHWVSKTTLATAADEESGLAKSDQVVLGVAGTLAALITLYSEFTLKTTGCGLPAGPFGFLGLAEGLSYLGVTGIAAYSVVTKVKKVRRLFDTV
jgi:hypothetical protein